MIRLDVDGQTCVLGPQEADDLASALRVLGLYGGDGSNGALALSYVLEDAVIDENFTRIPLDRPAAEAVYRVLNIEPQASIRYAELWAAVCRSRGRVA
jgi:hypothetical protein